MNVGQLSLESLEKYGEFDALHFEGATYSNVERDLYAQRLAGVLKSYGVGPGDHVTVMMPNSPDVTAAFQACWRLGAVIIPITPMLTAREAGFIIENSESKVVVTNPVLAQRVVDATKDNSFCQHILVIGEHKIDGPTNIQPEIATATSVDTLADRADDDMALLLYTSGTTGHPKGVMLTHKNMISNAKSVAGMNRIEPYSMNLSVLPLSHSFGVLMMNIGAVLGAKSVLLTHFDPTKALQSIQDFKVERFSAVPTMLTYLINAPNREEFDTSSLVKIATGGAALLNEVRLEFERLYNCTVVEGYGLSETAPSATGYREDEDYRPGSVGRAIPDVEVIIMGGDGQALASGETGEICIKGPNIMKGYWKQPDATEEAFRNGWFRSGDVGHMDEEGFIYITDRTKDLIIKGGENMSPREIEESIQQHPSVAECAVIGVPDAKFGENLWAIVALKPGKEATEDDIKAQTAKDVTKFKIPARVIFIPMLPKNPVGKILKKDLRKIYGEQAKKEAAAAAPV